MIFYRTPPDFFLGGGLQKFTVVPIAAVAASLAASLAAASFNGKRHRRR